MSAAKTIIVMGDDPSIINVLATVPDSGLWQIENVPSEVELLARLEARPCELVLTDERTPGADDVKLLKRIRQVRPDAKVIIIAADSTPCDIITALREHAFSYFTSPFDPKALTETIIQAMGVSDWDDGIEVLSACPTWIALRAYCRRLTADRVIQFLEEMKMDLPDQERADIGYAFREMLLNAIEHGGKADPNQKVRVDYMRTSQVLFYHLRDPGEGFSFDYLPHAAISNPPDSPVDHILYRAELGMRAGGFGILLSKNLVDELIYSEKGNEVILIKHLIKGNPE